MREAITSLMLPWLRNIRSTTVVRLLTLIGSGVALGTAALGVMLLAEARGDAWRQSEQALFNLTHALEQDIARTINTYDLSVQGTINALLQPGIDQASPEVRHLALFGHAAGAEYLGSLLLLDAEGNQLANSKSYKPGPLSFADRDYFLQQQIRPNAGLYISLPFQSRLRGGDPSIAVSRRVSNEQGRFQGIVVGTLRLAYFQDLFSKLDLGDKGSVTVLRTAGEVIARHPFRAADIGRSLRGTDSFQSLLAAPSGQFVGISTLDGVKRLYSFRHIGQLPLILSVAVSVDHIYEAWWSKAQKLGPILLVLCAATISLCLLFRREMLSRIAAEAALTAVAKRLSILAATDGLTGLANRRQFDVVLDQEWRRAIREETPLSLLLLDADHFKAYNDHYGHQEGDEVLKSIAASISEGILRPADTGARYGGEEFAVLLPGTDCNGGLTMSERIRGLVADRAIPHAGSPLERVTVSIGLTTLYPQIGEKADLLVQQADVALYEAKRGGRNRFAVSSGSCQSPKQGHAEWRDNIGQGRLSAHQPPANPGQFSG